MRLKPISTLLAMAMAAQPILAQAAMAEGYYFRARHTVIAAPAPLALGSSAGTSADLETGQDWDFTFPVSGGTGPYTFEVTPAQSGALAGIHREIGPDSVKLSGTAPVGSYTIRVAVKDSAKRTAQADLTVKVSDPAPAMANLERPSSVTLATGSFNRAYPEQPDWHVLYDGSDKTFVTANTTTPVVVKFDRPVTFDTVYAWSNQYQYPADILVKQDGQWVVAGQHRGLYSRDVKLNKQYTATEIGYRTTYYTSTLYDLRVGGGPPANLPRRKPSSPTVVAPSVDTISVSQFETQSPYRPGQISLEHTPAAQAGARLEVGKDSIKVLSRPYYNVDIGVVLATPDGLRTVVPLQLQAAPTGNSIIAPPTSITLAQGAITRTDETQPDWFNLYDGSDKTYVTATDKAYVVQTFAEPVTFDQVFVWSSQYQYPADIYVKQGGEWVLAGQQRGLYSQEVVLNRTYTATEVAFRTTYGTALLYEMRVGAKQAAAAATSVVAYPKLAPGESSIPVSAFQSKGFYNGGRISLAETPASQAGVELAVTRDEVRVLSRPAHNVDIGVAVRTEDGLLGVVPVQIQATGAGTSVTPPPSSVTPATGTVDAPNLAFPDWYALYDNSQASSVTANATGMVVMKFDKAVTFNQVYVWTNQYQYPADVLVKQGDRWVVAGQQRGLYSQDVQFARHYTATEVGFRTTYGSAYLYEMRVGSKSAATLVTAKSAAIIGPAQDTVTVTDLQAVSPYHGGRISLAETPTQQAGVRLEVTDTSVRVLSRPAYNVDIAVVARTEDGLRTGVKFQVQAAGAGTAASRYNPSEIVGGTGSLTTAYAGQPAWNVLNDGENASFGTALAANPLVIRFAEPIAVDRVFAAVPSVSYGMDVVIKRGTEWVKVGKMSNSSDTVLFGNTYVTNEIGLRPGYSSNNVQEFRAGGVAAVNLR